MQTVFVCPTPAAILATAKSNWDEDGCTVSCRISYPLAQLPAVGTPLLDALDKQFDITPSSYVITANALSLLLDAKRRLVAFDFFTNPRQWTECTLDAVTGTLVTPYFEATFDGLGHASETGEPELLYDPAAGVLCWLWGSAEAWCSIAPTLALGLAADGRLMQIRLDGLFVPATARGKQEHSVSWLTTARRLLGRS
jgi:hypothetical protein